MQIEAFHDLWPMTVIIRELCSGKAISLESMGGGIGSSKDDNILWVANFRKFSPDEDAFDDYFKTGRQGKNFYRKVRIFMETVPDQIVDDGYRIWHRLEFA